MLKDIQLSLILAKTIGGQRTTLQPVCQPMAVSNNHSTASALPPAPTTATSNSGGNNIVTKVMNPSLLQFKLGACITGRMHIKGPPSKNCLNCLESGHRFNKCLLLRLRELVHHCFNCRKADHLLKGCSMPRHQPHQVSDMVKASFSFHVRSAPVGSG